MPDKNDMLNLYFMDARSKLLDIAAFLDRVDRFDGEADFRHGEFLKALQAMLKPGGKTRAEAVLLSLSDLSVEPMAEAGMQGAVGACAPSDGKQGITNKG